MCHLSHMLTYLGACFLNILREIRLSRRTFLKCKLLLWNMISRPSVVKSRWECRRCSYGMISMENFQVQWNLDFSNPRFPEPSDISNQTLFPLDLLHSSSIISPPISRTLDFLKLPITRTNFGSRGTNWPWITRACENFQTTQSADVNYIGTFG